MASLREAPLDNASDSASTNFWSVLCKSDCTKTSPGYGAFRSPSLTKKIFLEYGHSEIRFLCLSIPLAA